MLYGPEYNPAPVRKPVVDLDATSVLNLIPRKDFKMEPIFTADLCRDKLYEIVFEKLVLPQREGFTQNVERLIRRTTEASAIYWQKDRRDAHIRAQQNVSLLLKRSKNKSDYLPLMKKARSI